MDDLDGHLKRISIALKKFQKWQMIGFGAWSLFPLTKDQKIIKFIDSISENNLVPVISSFIHSCWNNKQTNEEANHIYKKLTSFEWDEDSVSMEDEDSSQGAVDLLGGVELLSKYILKEKRKDIEDCAYQVFNRMDYKIDFSENDSEIKSIEKLFKEEKKNQSKIIEDISNTKPGEFSIENHHENLIKFFSKF